MRHEAWIRGYAVTHPPGTVELPTQAGWDQVVYAVSGLFDALTEHDTWLVPAHRALCVPDGVRVRVLTRQPTTMRCLYLRRGGGAGERSRSPIDEPVDLGDPFESVRAVDVTPLTRELLLRAVERAPLDLASAPQRALVTLLVDELAHEPSSALRLPLPRDDRARTFAVRIIREPTLSLDDALSGVGASRRTVERLVLAETGLTLTTWRRRARVLASIELLSAGAAVTAVATMVGYSTPSSFVAAFHTELGTSPKRFLTERLGVRPGRD